MCHITTIPGIHVPSRRIHMSCCLRYGAMILLLALVLHTLASPQHSAVACIRRPMTIRVSLPTHAHAAFHVSAHALDIHIIHGSQLTAMLLSMYTFCYHWSLMSVRQNIQHNPINIAINIARTYKQHTIYNTL